MITFFHKKLPASDASVAVSWCRSRCLRLAVWCQGILYFAWC